MVENTITSSSDFDESSKPLVGKIFSEGGTGDDILNNSGTEDVHILKNKSGVKELTPLEESEKEYRDSEVRKNESKILLFNALKKCAFALASILSIVIVVVAAGWAYGLTNISEPIGSIKTEIEHLKKYNEEDVKPVLKKLDSVYLQLKIKKIIILDD